MFLKKKKKKDLKTYHMTLQYHSLLGIYPEKNMIHKVTCTQIFFVALFATANTHRQSKCPSTEEWI